MLRSGTKKLTVFLFMSCNFAIHIYILDACEWLHLYRRILYVVKMCATASVIFKFAWKGLGPESCHLNIGSDKQKKQPLWEKRHNHNVSKSTSSAYKCNHLVRALRGTVKHNIPLREHFSRLSAFWDSGYSGIWTWCRLTALYRQHCSIMQSGAVFHSK